MHEVSRDQNRQDLSFGFIKDIRSKETSLQDFPTALNKILKKCCSVYFAMSTKLGDANSAQKNSIFMANFDFDHLRKLFPKRHQYLYCTANSCLLSTFVITTLK